MLEPVNYHMLNRYSALSMALHKIRHYDRRIWCAALTPMEAIALDKDHARVNQHDLDWCKRKKKEGNCYPSWVYLEVTEQQFAYLMTKDHNIKRLWGK